MNATIHDEERLDLAIPYLEKHLRLRGQTLQAILEDPYSTMEQIYDAMELYIETTNLLAYFRSLAPVVAIFAVTQFVDLPL